jgi:hypothetical protein
MITITSHGSAYQTISTVKPNHPTPLVSQRKHKTEPAYQTLAPPNPSAIPLLSPLLSLVPPEPLVRRPEIPRSIRCSRRKGVQQRALQPPAQGLPHRRPRRGRPRGPHRRRPRLLAGLTADGRVLSRFLRNEWVNHCFVYETPLPSPGSRSAWPTRRRFVPSAQSPSATFSAGFASICPYAHVFVVEESDTIYDFVLRV